MSVKSIKSADFSNVKVFNMEEEGFIITINSEHGLS